MEWIVLTASNESLYTQAGQDYMCLTALVFWITIIIIRYLSMNRHSSTPLQLWARYTYTQFSI